MHINEKLIWWSWHKKRQYMHGSVSIDFIWKSTHMLIGYCHHIEIIHKIEILHVYYNKNNESRNTYLIHEQDSRCLMITNVILGKRTWVFWNGVKNSFILHHRKQQKKPTRNAPYIWHTDNDLNGTHELMSSFKVHTRTFDYLICVLINARTTK